MKSANSYVKDQILEIAKTAGLSVKIKGKVKPFLKNGWNLEYLKEKALNHQEFCNLHGGKEKVYADLAVLSKREFEEKYNLI